MIRVYTQVSVYSSMMYVCTVRRARALFGGGNEGCPQTSEGRGGIEHSSGRGL